MKIENKYNVVKLIYQAPAFVYCPLGKDWGCVQIEAEISPDKYIPDYLDIDNFISENIDNKQHITEEVGKMVYDFIKEMIEPKKLTVRVHSQNNSLHSCYTTIGEDE